MAAALVQQELLKMYHFFFFFALISSFDTQTRMAAWFLGVIACCYCRRRRSSCRCSLVQILVILQGTFQNLLCELKSITCWERQVSVLPRGKVRVAKGTSSGM
jgi:hypothetical protein